MYRKSLSLALAAFVLALGSGRGAALGQSGSLANSVFTADSVSTPLYLDAAPTTAPAPKGPPLPFHTIEGVGGGAITPNAFLVNPGPAGTEVGTPTAAVSFVGLGQKNLLSLTATETLFGRVEVGYGAERLSLGLLPHDIYKATGVDIHSDAVWLHSFNARVQVIKENDGGDWVPAVTLGGQFKYNDGIGDIDSRLGGALKIIGYKRDYGEDFTLTTTKVFPKVFGRPLIVAAGGRLGSSADLGFLGFSDHWAATFEGHLLYLPTDWLAVAYEFRQNANPYNLKLSPLIGNEDSWHAFDAAWLINSHSSLVAGYGIFGNLANAKANSAWWLQFKYEL